MECVLACMRARVFLSGINAGLDCNTQLHYLFCLQLACHLGYATAMPKGACHGALEVAPSPRRAPVVMQVLAVVCLGGDAGGARLLTTEITHSWARLGSLGGGGPEQCNTMHPTEPGWM